MRIAYLVATLGFVVGCQHVDAADKSAAQQSKVAVAPAPKPAAVPRVDVPDQLTQPTGKDLTAAKKCGCAGGEGNDMACGDKCGEMAGGCGGGEAVSWGPLPEGTAWTQLHVTGMKCGGCAKKIESALAKVDGVKGVKIDWQAGKIEVAVQEGKDARAITKPVVDSLGYHVD
jgi:copper chaperone CopZ